MIYLMYGEDKYRANKFLKSLKEKNDHDGQGLNFFSLSGTSKIKDIENAIMSSPFLATTKLVTLDNFIKQSNQDDKSQIIDLLKRVPLDTDLVFIESQKPDQRLNITKALNQVAEVKIFDPLKQNDTVSWIEEMTQSLGGEISKPDAFLLLQKVGNDLMTLENEITKLTTYNKKITKESIDELIDPGFFNSIFELMDHISNKNIEAAQNNMLKTLESEEGNEIYILTMLSRQIRNLQLVKDLSAHRLSEPEIVSKTKLHPFVVKKTLEQSRNFTTEDLIHYQRLLLSADLRIKTTQTNPSLIILKLTNELASKK